MLFFILYSLFAGLPAAFDYTAGIARGSISEAETRAIIQLRASGAAIARNRLIGQDIFEALGVQPPANWPKRVDMISLQPSNVGQLSLLGAIEFLEGLSIVRANVRDDDLCRIPVLRHLKVLNAHGNRITDDALRCFQRFPRLRIANLLDNNISGPGIDGLAKLERLERLNLEGNPLTDEDIERFSKLAHLRSLSVGESGFERQPQTTITGKTLGKLAHCKELRNLDLKFLDKLDAKHLSDIKRITSLRYLSLFGSPIREDDFKFLLELNQLETLVLSKGFYKYDESGEISGLHVVPLQSVTRLRESLPHVNVIVHGYEDESP